MLVDHGVLDQSFRPTRSGSTQPQPATTDYEVPPGDGVVPEDNYSYEMPEGDGYVPDGGSYDHDWPTDPGPGDPGAGIPNPLPGRAGRPNDPGRQPTSA